MLWERTHTTDQDVAFNLLVMKHIRIAYNQIRNVIIFLKWAGGLLITTVGWPVVIWSVKSKSDGKPV